MSNEDVVGGGAGGAPRRAPRQGVGNSPVGSTLSIVLAVVAVIIGFFILNDLTSDDASGGSDAVETPAPDDITTTTFDAGVATTVVIPVTTAPPFVTEGATVAVANGNTVGGSAGRMSETLAGVGFQMGSPVNAANTVDESIVYFDPGVAQAEAVARSVAIALGGIAVEAVPTPPPTESATMGDAAVILVLGNNQADKTLEQLAEAGGLAVQDTGAAPAVAGGDVVAPVTSTTVPA